MAQDGTPQQPTTVIQLPFLAHSPIIIEPLPVYSDWELPVKERLIRRSVARKAVTEQLRAKRLASHQSPSKAADPTKPSFLSLPAEIRNQIYALLFDNRNLTLDYKAPYHKKIQRTRVKPLRFHLEFVLTCHAIERDLDGFIFDRCTFAFRSDQALRKFIGMAPDANLARIKKLSLFVFVGDMDEWREVVETAVVPKFKSLGGVKLGMYSFRAGKDSLRECVEALEGLVKVEVVTGEGWASCKFFLPLT
ncbi:MAG: hypothetical protein Q9195_005785 [Heterodermia aff. obscurata]